MTFNPDKIQQKIRSKTEKSLREALMDGVDDLQKRLDSGRGTDGRKYQYSDYTAKKKGKKSPVDFIDTGTLRRSVDYDIKHTATGIRGRIGIKDLGRGKASNIKILEGLISRFPNMWGFSKSGATKILKYFKENYSSS